jgi:hypothetical protein
VTADTTTSLQLVIINKKTRDITFQIGKLVEEGTAAPGDSIFYLHFGNMVAQSDVPNIQFNAPGLSFKSFSSSFYGQYWGAICTSPLDIKNNQSITIDLTNVKIASQAGQVPVYFDYYNISGLNDGVYQETVSIQASNHSLSTPKKELYV